MAQRDTDVPAADAGSNLTPAYIRVLVLEAVVLTVLFWLGVHFA